LVASKLSDNTLTPQHTPSTAKTAIGPLVASKLSDNTLIPQHTPLTAKTAIGPLVVSKLSNSTWTRQHTQRRITMLILVYIALSSILVYATAVRLRFEQPTVNDIRRKTGTELDEMIVSSLIGAARRLLPIDNTPQGNALRIEQHRIKLADSKRAEDTFCAELDRLGYVFLREAQQEGEAVTPDVRFIKPTNVCGHLCMWLEYKNYSDSDQIHMWHQPAKVNTRSMGLR